MAQKAKARPKPKARAKARRGNPLAPYKPVVDAATKLQFGGEEKALGAQETQLHGHAAGIDAVYRAYAGELAGARERLTSGFDAARGQLHAAGDAGAQAATAAQGALGDQAAELAARRGGNVSDAAGTVLGEGIAATGAGRDRVGAQEQALVAQGTAQQGRLERLGLIAQGARGQYQQETANALDAVKAGRVDLAARKGAFRVGKYDELLKSDREYALAEKTLNVKEGDSLRDYRATIAGIKSNQQIAADNNATREAIARGDRLSREQIASLDREQRATYYANQKAHWDAQDEAALNGGGGGGGATVNRGDGTQVRFTPAQRDKWVRLRNHLDSARRQLEGEWSRTGNVQDAIKSVKKRTGLQDDVVRALMSYVQRGSGAKGWIGPAAYGAIAAIMPHGVVPKGLWQRAPDGYKAEFFARAE